jgi:hypothetical protein
VIVPDALLVTVSVLLGSPEKSIPPLPPPMAVMSPEFTTELPTPTPRMPVDPWITPPALLVTVRPPFPLIPAASKILSGMSALPMVPELMTVSAPLAKMPLPSPTPPIPAVVMVPALLTVLFAPKLMPKLVLVTVALDCKVIVLPSVAKMPLAPFAEEPVTCALDCKVMALPFATEMPLAPVKIGGPSGPGKLPVTDAPD